MIISASYRTDIPAFYSTWFRNRFRAGSAMVRNPYGGKPSRVALRDGVTGYVFWTRNIEPFLPALAEVRRAGLPFTVQYTVTGYPRPLETSVIAAARSVALIRRLAVDWGPRAVVWRYDPILLTDLTPPDWHRKNFAALARGLEGAVDEVVVSFLQAYRKTTRNLDSAGHAHPFAWRHPDPPEKHQILNALRAMATASGMGLTLCTQPDQPGEPARCIDPRRLRDLGGDPVLAPTKGNRPGCLCAESRDIGAYDTCPHGCVYCYAVNRQETAKRHFQAHDPDDAFLMP